MHKLIAAATCLLGFISSAEAGVVTVSGDISVDVGVDVDVSVDHDPRAPDGAVDVSSSEGGGGSSGGIDPLATSHWEASVAMLIATERRLLDAELGFRAVIDAHDRTVGLVQVGMLLGSR